MKMTTRAKKCKACGISYITTRPLQKACSLPCALILGKQKTEQDKKKQERIGRAADKKKLESLKPKIYWEKLAERYVNHLVIVRDRYKPCISCGRFHQGDNHAGHFLSVGSHPEIRYDLRNIHKQCKPCNVDKHGNYHEYRKALPARVGQDVLDWLDGPHEIPHRTIDDLKKIAADARKMTKELHQKYLTNSKMRSDN
jgi:hypothetical protein